MTDRPKWVDPSPTRVGSYWSGTSRMAPPAFTPRAAGGRGGMSAQEIAVFRTLMQAGKDWLSSREIAQDATPVVAPRTVRAILKGYADRGIVEWAQAFPGHRYRLSSNAPGSEYASQVRRTAEVLGLSLWEPATSHRQVR